MIKVAFLVCALLLLRGASADIEEVPAEDGIYDSYRLPSAVTPENYKLEVITHLNDTEGFVFRGVVWITVSIKISSLNLTSQLTPLKIKRQHLSLLN